MIIKAYYEGSQYEIEVKIKSLTVPCHATLVNNELEMRAATEECIDKLRVLLDTRLKENVRG